MRAVLTLNPSDVVGITTIVENVHTTSPSQEIYCSDGEHDGGSSGRATGGGELDGIDSIDN